METIFTPFEIDITIIKVNFEGAKEALDPDHKHDDILQAINTRLKFFEGYDVSYGIAFRRADPEYNEDAFAQAMQMFYGAPECDPEDDFNVLSCLAPYINQGSHVYWLADLREGATIEKWSFDGKTARRVPGKIVF